MTSLIQKMMGGTAGGKADTGEPHWNACTPRGAAELAVPARGANPAAISS